MRAAGNKEEDELASSELELSSLSSSDSFEPKAFEGNPVEIKRPPVSKLPSEASRDFASEKSSVTLRDGPETHEQGSFSSSSSLPDVDKVVTHNVKEGLSENVESLEEQGLDLRKKAKPDINSPVALSSNTEFPEEYNLETQTGLVKAVTLQQLNRLDSRTSARSGQSQKKSLKSSIASLELPDATSVKSRTDSGLDSEKLRKAVEKNQKQIEKYQERKKKGGVKGFIAKIFS
ncbi:LAFA_0D06898g1_1 [Lachancea sp. 'fantastica']|nr:LAFA_0D06898g1_1 [Lachancea sp. 'fantastica']